MTVRTSLFLDDWRNEFCPVAAKDFLDTAPDARALIDFDLRLWRGARAENARKHRVIYWWRALLAEPELDAEGREGRPLQLRLSGEMALCARYARRPDCAGCPLRAWQGAPCGGSDAEDAWARCVRDPEPMVAALEACRAALDRPPSPAVRIVLEVEDGRPRALRADPPDAVAAILIEYGESPYAGDLEQDDGVRERAAAWRQSVGPLTRAQRAMFGSSRR